MPHLPMCINIRSAYSRLGRENDSRVASNITVLPSVRVTRSGSRWVAIGLEARVRVERRVGPEIHKRNGYLQTTVG